jgi:hypothetical protein
MKLRIALPMRGPPPRCPEGYEPEPGNPYAFTKKWRQCPFHAISTCGRHVCALKGIPVNQNVCETCSLAPSLG